MHYVVFHQVLKLQVLTLFFHLFVYILRQLHEVTMMGESSKNML